MMPLLRRIPHPASCTAPARRKGLADERNAGMVGIVGLVPDGNTWATFCGQLLAVINRWTRH